MKDSKQQRGEEGFGDKQKAFGSPNAISKKNKKDYSSGKTKEGNDDRDVLIKAGPLKYKLPGKKQRVIIGSIVLGLNVLFVLAVLLYFYNPSFQEFIYTVGRS